MVWIKARCDNDTCVEVSPGTRVWVRDSTDPGVVLSVDRAAWREFVTAVKEGTWAG